MYGKDPFANSEAYQAFLNNELETSASKGDIERLLNLLSRGADATAVDLASVVASVKTTEQAACVLALVSKGADACAPDVVIEAAENTTSGHVILPLLIAKGADMSVIPSYGMGQYRQSAETQDLLQRHAKGDFCFASSRATNGQPALRIKAKLSDVAPAQPQSAPAAAQCETAAKIHMFPRL